MVSCYIPIPKSSLFTDKAMLYNINRFHPERKRLDIEFFVISIVSIRSEETNKINSKIFKNEKKSKSNNNFSKCNVN